jgi:aminoacrylate peracid reductase
LTKEIIIPPGSAPPLAPYSPGVRSGDVAYVSGTLPMDSEGSTVGPEDVQTQTRHVLESVKSVIEDAGGNMSDIVYNMIFLKGINDYSAMNSVYEKYFQESPPARWCIRADLVKPEFLVEITSIAHLGRPTS